MRSPKVRMKPARTISVPDAGAEYYGLSKNAAYAAAARGEIPTIRVGRLLRVPRELMERKLLKISESA
jgi:excisionase family DNA binding protein